MSPVATETFNNFLTHKNISGMLLQASRIYGILVGCRLPPPDHSPPNEVKGRGGGRFEDIIPIHNSLHLEEFQCDMLLGLKE